MYMDNCDTPPSLSSGLASKEPPWSWLAMEWKSKACYIAPSKKKGVKGLRWKWDEYLTLNSWTYQRSH